jgi:hypothetical protein
MRIKIIAVNALIVAVVGLLSFWLVRAQLSSATGNKDQLSADARRDAQGAAARLQLDGLRAERWLTTRAAEPATQEPLTKGTANARGEAATKRADELTSQMKGSPLFEGNVPTYVALVDAAGRIVGRNGSALARGDDLATAYPGLRQTLTTGQSGSDVWVDKDRYLATYVAVHDEKGQIIGALVVGRPLADTLARVSEETTGRPLVLMVSQKDQLDPVAHSQTSPLDESITKGAREGIRGALLSGHAGVVKDGEFLVAAAPLEALGDGHRAVLVAAAPASPIEGSSALSISMLAATAVGILLVIMAGWLLGNYITRPIATLEEGLLAILNGQADRRFELDHAELGGLAFRIDQLLNQLMGVEEDTTDAEGRPSHEPDTSHFSDAMSVEEKRMQSKVSASELGASPEQAATLAAEPASSYYARIYREYIGAKRNLGEATEHITEQAFVQRIQGMEKEAAAKYGRPVRYQVQQRGNEVVLLAVPLS